MNSGYPGSPSRWTIAVFVGTSFLSAFLLFLVQLVVNKYILPWFGGTAAVWTTSLLVFQVLLLCGYAYAHLISERLLSKGQSRLHLGILAGAFFLVAMLSLVWPSAIQPGMAWRPQNSTTPAWDVSVTLLIAAGLPFFVLSTTGPLLQRWFAQRGGGTQTYRLYAVSNLGSLLGLLSFPFALEPTLHLITVGRLWVLLFVVFLAGCAWCAWGARPYTADPAAPETMSPAAEGKPSVLKAILWFLLAACASAQLLAATNYLCQNIISIPLLWVLPLALYLLSFILCFDQPRWYRREIFHPLLVAGILGICFASNSQKLVIVPLLLFVVCMICHGELVKLKPDVRHLTFYYLAISGGGALGGIFVAIVSPLIFRSFAEFQISLGAAIVLLLVCLALDGYSWLYRLEFPQAAALAGVMIIAAYAASRWSPELAKLLQRYSFYPLALFAAVLVLTGAFLHRPTVQPGQRAFYPGQLLVVLLALLLGTALYRDTLPAQSVRQVYAERNFYGILRVEDQVIGKVLFHGTTLHGAQSWPPDDRLPTTYYGPRSGIGLLMQERGTRHLGNGSLRVGLVGLGTGTLAAYGMPGDYFRYYEIDPAVVGLSTGVKPMFTYLRDSRAKIDIEVGDARLLLERELTRGEPGNFDVLVLDAFSADAIPVHLLTVEAFDTYWKHLNPRHGVIAIHISSNHVDLLPVTVALAEHFHCTFRGRWQSEEAPYQPNLWVFLSRDPEALQIDGLYPRRPNPPGAPPPRLWTDDYSDIFHLLR